MSSHPGIPIKKDSQSHTPPTQPRNLREHLFLRRQPLTTTTHPQPQTPLPKPLSLPLSHHRPSSPPFPTRIGLTYVQPRKRRVSADEARTRGGDDVLQSESGEVDGGVVDVRAAVCEDELRRVEWEGLLVQLRLRLLVILIHVVVSCRALCMDYGVW